MPQAFTGHPRFLRSVQRDVSDVLNGPLENIGLRRWHPMISTLWCSRRNAIGWDVNPSFRQLTSRSLGDPMSDQAVVDQIHFAQGDRFLRFSGSQFPLGDDEMNSHVANMHLIPATPDIASQFKTAVHGQIVTMSGYLVRVDAQDGFHWVSSMSRSDRGAGACELMWVERFSLR